MATWNASLPIAYRLYLPEIWANDSQLRRQAKIPNDIVFQTKLEIALGQIRQAIADGIPQGTVLADPAYGNDTGFRQAVAKMKLSYVLGIQSTTTIWPPGTQPLPAPEYSGHGRPATRFDFSFSIWIAHLARQCRHAVVRQNVAIQGIQARIVKVRRQHAFAKVVQDHDPWRTAKPTKCLLVKLGPHPRTRSEGQQPNRLPTASQRQNEQPRRPSAITCSCFVFSKTLPMPTEANFPRSVGGANVLGRFSMAGFEVIIYGRFWVIAEDMEHASRSFGFVDRTIPAASGVT